MSIPFWLIVLSTVVLVAVGAFMVWTLRQDYRRNRDRWR